MDVPAEYRSRMNALERELRELREQLNAIYSRREPNVIPPSEVVFIGKTDAAINKGASGTVSRYNGSASTETDTTINDTVKNRFANVGSGKWVAYTLIDNVFYMIAAEC